jgi:hypothetical protein
MLSNSIRYNWTIPSFDIQPFMGISKNSDYSPLLVEGAGVEVMRARVFRDALM